MRRRLDAYQTGRALVEPLLPTIELNRGQIVFEPCVGEGRIADAIRERWITVVTNDVDPLKDAWSHLDMTLEKSWQDVPTCDWIITNPPFNAAYDILKYALRYHTPLGGVAFLLRLSFLEPTYDRQELLHRNPPTSLIVLPRYSFTENGKTDSVTCAWMIWEDGKTGTIKIAEKL